MLTVFDHTQTENKRERIIVYAAPGVGKSRFVLSLTERFGKILYYASDPNSRYLDSISPEKAKRVIVIDQEPDPDTGILDPIANFEEFCMHDWSAEFPDIGTIVVDTYTYIMQQAIMQSANQGLAGTKPHFRVGNIDKGGQAIPTWDDYLGTEGLSRGLIKEVFDHQRKFNIIFVCHEDVKQVEGMPATGGPSHPGRKMLVDMPAAFSTVIRLIKEPVMTPGDDAPHTQVIAITDHDGKFIAKARTKDETGASPLGRVVLDSDPVNFWKQYDAVYAPVLAQEEVANG